MQRKNWGEGCYAGQSRQDHLPQQLPGLSGGFVRWMSFTCCLTSWTEERHSYYQWLRHCLDSSLFLSVSMLSPANKGWPPYVWSNPYIHPLTKQEVQRWSVSGLGNSMVERCHPEAVYPLCHSQMLGDSAQDDTTLAAAVPAVTSSPHPTLEAEGDSVLLVFVLKI